MSISGAARYNTYMKHKPVKFSIALLIVYAAAAIGSIVTFPAIHSWYVALSKPSFNPPNDIFGPVWTVLYTLMGVSLYIVWVARSKASKRAAFTIFSAQLALNTLWSIVFFGMQQLWLAVVVIAALWLLIIATMWRFWKFSHVATYLLIPYLVWVTFASVLNISIAILNR
jgi:translocator protein